MVQIKEVGYLKKQQIIKLQALFTLSRCATMVKMSSALIFLSACLASCGSSHKKTINDIHGDLIYPVHKKLLKGDNKFTRYQFGNPRIVEGYLVFDGTTDGDRQVDPQVAAGGGYVVEASNNGLLVYDKTGKCINGVSFKAFNDGIDPKLAFDVHNRIFLFDTWWYYDRERNKPVNICVSETSDPNGAWNIYAIPRPTEVDGGALGYSRKWMGYSYPGGDTSAFVMRTSELKAGKPAHIYYFKKFIGNPVLVQDDIDDLYFFSIDDSTYTVGKISEDTLGKPYYSLLFTKHHHLQYADFPRESPQKGTTQKISSGDRFPKNLIVQNGSLWISEANDCNGRSAVQWFQIRLTDGEIIQRGLIKSDTTNYIQTSIAVNKNDDVIIGFQEVNEHSFISPRIAFHRASDPKGTIRNIVRIGEGTGATEGDLWGDYSGSCVDGDNFRDLWTIQSRANEFGHAMSVIIKVPAHNP